MLFQSPITVKEKLDVLYDLADAGSYLGDGINLSDALNIYQTVLSQHLYYLPNNELKTQVEQIFNRGETCGIVAAYWTKKMQSELKFDMSRDSENGVSSLEEFVGLTNIPKDLTKFSAVDVTKEV